jgi:CRP-like cAMP-binding protein
MARLFGGKRTERDPILRVLRGVPIFEDLSRRELQRLRAILHTRSYKKGELMFEFGQPGAAMFVIQTGEVAITLPDEDSDEELTLATLQAGSFLGELALLDDSPRSASARCAKPTEALAFFRSDLNKLLETAPEIGSKIYRELAVFIGQRLKAMNEQLSEKDAIGHAIEQRAVARGDDEDDDELGE